MIRRAGSPPAFSGFGAGRHHRAEAQQHHRPGARLGDGRRHQTGEKDIARRPVAESRRASRNHNICTAEIEEIVRALVEARHSGTATNPAAADEIAAVDSPLLARRRAPRRATHEKLTTGDKPKQGAHIYFDERAVMGISPIDFILIGRIGNEPETSLVANGIVAVQGCLGRVIEAVGISGRHDCETPAGVGCGRTQIARLRPEIDSAATLRPRLYKAPSGRQAQELAKPSLSSSDSRKCGK